MSPLFPFISDPTLIILSIWRRADWTVMSFILSTFCLNCQWQSEGDRGQQSLLVGLGSRRPLRWSTSCLDRWRPKLNTHSFAPGGVKVENQFAWVPKSWWWRRFPSSHKVVRKELKGGGGEKAWHVVLRVISRDLRLNLFTYLLANRMWCVCCYGLDCNNKGEPRLSKQTTRSRINHGKLDVWRHGFDSLSTSHIRREKTRTMWVSECKWNPTHSGRPGENENCREIDGDRWPVGRSHYQLSRG